MYLFQIYLGFFALEGTGHLGIKAAFSVLSFATLAHDPYTRRNWLRSLFFVMETLLIYSIASPVGMHLAGYYGCANTAIVIVLGLLSLLFLPYINKNKHEVHSGHTG
jgi:hypothetical protein